MWKSTGWKHVKEREAGFGRSVKRKKENAHRDEMGIRSILPKINCFAFASAIDDTHSHWADSSK